MRWTVIAVVCVRASLASADPPTDPDKPTTVNAEPVPLPPTPPVPTQTNPVSKEFHGPWYRGPYATNRFINLGVTAGIDALLLTDQALGLTFPPSECRWCSPLPFDRGARHWFLWKDTNLASSLSDYTTFYISPIVGVALLVASEGDFSASRLIDDILPVAETVSIVQAATRIAKYSVGRRRPYAYYGGATLDPSTEDNQSFWSGHSVIGFAITSAAGTVCHFRHYWTEPYVWAAGITLSLTTEYLRMAADRHWLSDVVTGGLVGIGTGLLVPRLMQRSVKIVPVSNGLAVAGSF